MHDLIRAYTAHLIAGGSADTTLRLRTQLLERLSVELPAGLAGATTQDLAQWLAERSWARWTRYTYFCGISAFYGWAHRAGLLPGNPAAGLMRPRIPRGAPRPATEEQLARALAMVPEPWRTAIVLGAYAGLRCAEIASLRREQVRQDTLRVRRKGGRVAELPTHDLIWSAVVDLPAGPVVPRPSGRPYTSDGLSHRVAAALARAGLTPLTLHWFRHRYATTLLLPVEYGGVGADIRTVQELMGHASLESTQLYTQVTSAQRRRAVAALPIPTVLPRAA